MAGDDADWPPEAALPQSAPVRQVPVTQPPERQRCPLPQLASVVQGMHWWALLQSWPPEQSVETWQAACAQVPPEQT